MLQELTKLAHIDFQILPPTPSDAPSPHKKHWIISSNDTKDLLQSKIAQQLIELKQAGIRDVVLYLPNKQLAEIPIEITAELYVAEINKRRQWFKTFLFVYESPAEEHPLKIVNLPHLIVLQKHIATGNEDFNANDAKQNSSPSTIQLPKDWARSLMTSLRNLLRNAADKDAVTKKFMQQWWPAFICLDQEQLSSFCIELAGKPHPLYLGIRRALNRRIIALDAEAKNPTTHVAKLHKAQDEFKENSQADTKTIVTRLVTLEYKTDTQGRVPQKTKEELQKYTIAQLIAVSRLKATEGVKGLVTAQCLAQIGLADLRAAYPLEKLTNFLHTKISSLIDKEATLTILDAIRICGGGMFLLKLDPADRADRSKTQRLTVLISWFQGDPSHALDHAFRHFTTEARVKDKVRTNNLLAPLLHPTTIEQHINAGIPLTQPYPLTDDDTDILLALVPEYPIQKIRLTDFEELLELVASHSNPLTNELIESLFSGSGLLSLCDLIQTKSAEEKAEPIPMMINVPGHWVRGTVLISSQTKGGPKKQVQAQLNIIDSKECSRGFLAYLAMAIKLIKARLQGQQKPITFSFEYSYTSEFTQPFDDGHSCGYLGFQGLLKERNRKGTMPQQQKTTESTTSLPDLKLRACHDIMRAKLEDDTLYHAIFYACLVATSTPEILLLNRQQKEAAKSLSSLPEVSQPSQSSNSFSWLSSGHPIAKSSGPTEGKKQDKAQNLENKDGDKARSQSQLPLPSSAGSKSTTTQRSFGAFPYESGPVSSSSSADSMSNVSPSLNSSASSSFSLKPPNSSSS